MAFERSREVIFVSARRSWRSTVGRLCSKSLLMMKDEQPFGVNPTMRADERLVVSAVRAVVRRLVSADRDDMAGMIEAIGRDAIRAAAEASLRLGAQVTDDGRTTALLDDLEQLAASAVAAPPRKRSRWFGGEPDLPRAPPLDLPLERLIPRIEAERDRVALDLIRLGAARERLALAACNLDEAIRLAGSLPGGLAAAAREIRSVDANRAAQFDTVLPRILLERERELATQIVITQQGVLTLDTLIAARTALADALERARTVTLAALGARVAAGQAVASARAVEGQTAALGQVARAAAESTDRDQAAVDRALADAATQVRAALGMLGTGRAG